MKISVVTVCFNSEKTIRDTIESVISQSYSDIEFIIVDGCSSDKTMEIVGGYMSEISLVICEPDEGIYDAMNKGVGAATGDYITILNSDDFFESDSVVADVAVLIKENTGKKIFFSDIVQVAPENLNRIVRYYSSKNFKPLKLRFGLMPAHPGSFVATEVYRKIGCYSLNYDICSDFDFFVRALYVKKIAYYYTGVTAVRMRTGGASASGFKSKLKLNSEIVKCCRDNQLYTNIFIVLLKTPWRIKEYILARIKN